VATSPAKKSTSPKAAPAASKAAPAKDSGRAGSATAAASRGGAKAAGPAAKAAGKNAKAPAAKAPVKPASAPAKTAAPSKAAPAKAHAPAKAPSVAKAPAAKPAHKAPAKPPAPKPAAKSHKKAPAGITPSEHFDADFLEQQRAALRELRAEQLGQAERLEGEAASLMEEQETGDVQFDEESGEGDTIAVERERDLALSAQARQIIADIDAALTRIADGTYGYSSVSGLPIPRERLEALPWATALVEEKVGGLGARR
jgi:RNA polymerase-binding transcription factor DksA